MNAFDPLIGVAAGGGSVVILVAIVLVVLMKKRRFFRGRLRWIFHAIVGKLSRIMITLNFKKIASKILDLTCTPNTRFVTIRLTNGLKFKLVDTWEADR